MRLPVSMVGRYRTEYAILAIGLIAVVGAAVTASEKDRRCLLYTSDAADE